jgi:aminopeptidase
LAKNIVDYATGVKPNDKVLIEATDPITYPMVAELVRQVYAVGGFPFTHLHADEVDHALHMGALAEQYDLEASFQRARMENMDVFIGIRGSMNALNLSDVSADRMKIFSSTIMQKVHMEVRLPKTRWVVLRFPNSSFAQAAKMSTQQFEDFYFNCCLLNYRQLSIAMDPLVELMQHTNCVHIKGPGTDLRFSIKGIPAIKCDGKLNIPDGEVFTAPVKDSVNGVLQTNTPTLYEGNYFSGVRLVFENGKIVEESCETGDAVKLKGIFDRDEGSRFVGEFALGVNPEINREMLDILFDEKIAGSFHFTPGNSYDEAPNGNKSEVHWDLVTRQFKKDGGGEIWFDDVLIRKDGIFILPELEGLNPAAFGVNI